ncbi:carbohydrate kinase family protein [Rubripirellula obstinata]|nr:carbohydrate kinase family protein [Rubripirellula obstinata]
MKFAKKQSIEIVGIGVSVLDLVMVVDDLPGEEEVLEAIDRFSGLGGGVSVAMATAASMGISTAMLDCLGTDNVSDSIVCQLADAGVDTQLIDRDENVSASLATVWVKQSNGSRTIVFSPGKFKETEPLDFQWTDRCAEIVSAAKFLHLNGRHFDASMKAVEVAKHSGVKVSYDGGAYRYRAEILPLVEQADVFIVSEHFARTHCESKSKRNGVSDSPASLCQALIRDFDSELVGVTCGDRGSWFATSGGDAFHQPADRVAQVVDTTGCGDTFHGAMLAAMVRGLPLRACSEIAAKVAAHQAKHLGAFSPTISGLGILPV